MPGGQKVRENRANPGPPRRSGEQTGDPRRGKRGGVWRNRGGIPMAHEENQKGEKKMASSHREQAGASEEVNAIRAWRDLWKRLKNPANHQTHQDGEERVRSRRQAVATKKKSTTPSAGSEGEGVRKGEKKAFILGFVAGWRGKPERIKSGRRTGFLSWCPGGKEGVRTCTRCREVGAQRAPSRRWPTSRKTHTGSQRHTKPNEKKTPPNNPTNKLPCVLRGKSALIVYTGGGSNSRRGEILPGKNLNRKEDNFFPRLKHRQHPSAKGLGL